MPRVVQVAKGERLLKDVYQALRAGPKWQQTLLFVAYDDGGGYYDHIVPPFEGVPADESPCHVAGTRNTTACGPAFDFRRLGLRSGAMLISPLVERGSVFQEPRGPFAGSADSCTGWRAAPLSRWTARDERNASRRPRSARRSRS